MMGGWVDRYLLFIYYIFIIYNLGFSINLFWLPNLFFVLINQKDHLMVSKNPN